MRGQLKHGCQSGKRIGHLILLSGNMVEGYVIKELYQLLGVGLVGYQLMIPSLPFSSQLVNYQAESPYNLSNLTLKSIAASIPRAQASYSTMLFVQSKPNQVVKGMH